MLIVYAILVLGILGAIFGAILAFAAKIFHVDVDPKQEAIRECLAGANCGGCGYPGCADRYAQDLGNLFSSFSTTCNTAVRRSLALCYCSSIAVAAGVAAAAAVCTGQAFTNSFLLGVYINVEDLGSKCKDCTKQSAKNTQN